MNQKNRLSNNTKDYLSTFYCILNDMIQSMTEAELGNSISYNFIVQMIPHHMAAIEMSKNVLKYTTNITLQDIALQIIEEQTKSIENMRSILCTCEKRTNSRQDLYLYQRRTIQIMNIMFSKMENAKSTNNINANFIWEMIPHHKGAIAMSKNALQYNICPELTPILKSIITSQEKGVIEMQNLLQHIRCED